MNKITGVIVGAVAMVLTTLLFVLMGGACFGMAVYWIGFCSVLLMEFAGIMLLLFAEGQVRRVAAAVGFLLCAVVSAVLTALLLILFPDGVAGVLVFELIVAAIASVQAVILWRHSETDQDRNVDRETTRAFFESCRKVVAVLMESPEGRPHMDGLRKLDDDLRFADDTKSTELDGSIKEMLTNLSGGLQDAGYDPTMILSELRDLLRQRQKMLHP